ncbi:hypothetical protein FNV43_RR13366 [Rhamnella rubrinervis]|uniref:Uncharacterized protein n=1 Tax=Rhamnella rubrinervis TaxID=2594499 RepID=A0A8K0MF35_9ROSA|nr:hypothetical protein FNV43_RR13366 [Rhamnella rubrinervis]
MEKKVMKEKCGTLEEKVVNGDWIFLTYVGEDLPNHSTLVVTFSLMLTFIVLVNLVLVSATNPGIIPRNEKEQLVDKIGIMRKKRVTINGVEMNLNFSCWRIHQRLAKSGTGCASFPALLIKTCPETLALASFSFAASLFLNCLIIFHVYLIAINQTAYENFRQRFVGAKNPYDKGILCNFKEVFFVRLPPPRVDFQSEITPTW